MKKLLLVVFVSLVLAIDAYGIANDIIDHIETEKAESEVATVVYVE